MTATATGRDGEVRLHWANPSDPSFQRVVIYRSTAAGQLGTKLSAATSSTTSSYTDTGLSNGTTYYYTLHAVDVRGNESTDTSQVSATPAM